MRNRGSDMPTIDETRERLRRHGQEQLLRFWDDLSADERAALAADIDSVDFELIERLFREESAGEDWAALSMRAESPDAIRLDGHGRPCSPDEARTRGEEALAAGRVAAILVAGGQGSRLGFDHPKGMFPIGPVSGATLFQILLEKVLATARRYRTRVPLGIMTSPATHDETVAYLDGQHWFGLPADNVRVFCQGTLPAVDARTGKLLLAERGRLALSPDGHGGMLAALAKSGLLEEFVRCGIRQVFYFQVDSPVAQVCDPEFIGYHLLTGSEMSTQVVAKRDPLDRVGNLALVDGHTRIIEYSDLPDEAAGRRQADGSLVLWAGNIAVHVMDLDFLGRMAQSADALPFHRALKKVPYIDDTGQLVEPEKPNALKFERFIFDLLPSARRAIAVEADPATAFAPVKNADSAGVDCPRTVQAQMISLHTAWLRQAGVEVAAEVPVEISPLLALDADELKAKVQSGMNVTGPRYFEAGDTPSRVKHQG
jgi:UDP-N-acetylglucosamine/UDP-N-acetylgalactosamine diphosphorylase